jgi:hypothetical protein
MEAFTGSAAVRRGEFTRRGLARQHRAIYRDVYVRRDVELTARIRAEAAWLATGATLAGVSAAAVLGTKWLDSSRPAEIIRSDQHSRDGIVVHSWDLRADEQCTVKGMKITTPARTAFDIGRTCTQSQAIPILDALSKVTGVKAADVLALADARPRVRGVRRLRAAIELVDGGAESPPESRLRLLLVSDGLPKPETQIEFYDDFGQAFIRVDIGWRDWKVAVEYDGIQHWADRRQRAWDIDRIAILEERGWVVIRVGAELMTRPDVILERVRAKRRAARSSRRRVARSRPHSRTPRPGSPALPCGAGRRSPV